MRVVKNITAAQLQPGDQLKTYLPDQIVVGEPELGPNVAFRVEVVVAIEAAA